MALSQDEALIGGPVTLTAEEEAAVNTLEAEIDKCLIGSYQQNADLYKRGVQIASSTFRPKNISRPAEVELRKRYRAAGWNVFELRWNGSNYEVILAI